MKSAQNHRGNEWVRLTLRGDGRRATVARNDQSVVGQRERPLSRIDRRIVSSDPPQKSVRPIEPANSVSPASSSGTSNNHLEIEAAWTRACVRACATPVFSRRPKATTSSPRQLAGGGWRRVPGLAVGLRRTANISICISVPVVQPAVFGVKQHLGPGRGGDVGGAHHVIEVGVRVQKILTAVNPSPARSARMSAASSPGSTTSACRVSGQAGRYVQLQASCADREGSTDQRHPDFRYRSRSGTPLTINHHRGRPLGEHLVGSSSDVDEPTVGDVGGQKSEPYLGRHQHRRRRRAVQTIGQAGDLGQQIRVIGSCRCPSMRLDSQTVKRSRTSAPLALQRLRLERGGQLFGGLDQFPGACRDRDGGWPGGPSARRPPRCARRRKARAAVPARRRAAARTPILPDRNPPVTNVYMEKGYRQQEGRASRCARGPASVQDSPRVPAAGTARRPGASPWAPTRRSRGGRARRR